MGLHVVCMRMAGGHGLLAHVCVRTDFGSRDVVVVVVVRPVCSAWVTFDIDAAS